MIQSDSETHLFLLLFYTSKMICIKFELNVMHVVGQVSWVTSLENSEYAETLRDVAGQNRNANNWRCICGAMPNVVLATVQL